MSNRSDSEIAADDFSDFIALTKREPIAAKALEDCLKDGCGVLIGYPDGVSALTGDFVIKLKLNERLAGVLQAFRAS